MGHSDTTQQIQIGLLLLANSEFSKDCIENAPEAHVLTVWSPDIGAVEGGTKIDGFPFHSYDNSC